MSDICFDLRHQSPALHSILYRHANITIQHSRLLPPHEQRGSSVSVLAENRQSFSSFLGRRALTERLDGDALLRQLHLTAQSHGGHQHLLRRGPRGSIHGHVHQHVHLSISLDPLGSRWTLGQEHVIRPREDLTETWDVLRGCGCWLAALWKET